MTQPTWVDINLAAIENNARHMQALTGARVMAVVKANAYGHGAVEVSRAAVRAGAAYLGVARASEGLALRQANITAPILVLGYTPPEQAAEAIAQALTLTVFTMEDARAYDAAAQALQREVRVHLKVDTGMGRLGVLPSEAPALYRAICALPHLSLDGVFTHFAGSDMADLSAAQQQLHEFKNVLQQVERPPLVHACNSAAAFAMPSARFDLVRMGIALYGMNPSDDVPCPAGFIPALTWKARITQVKTLPPGHGVSYGPEYVTTTTETIATLPVGYADGYRRVPQGVNAVLVHGQRAPVLGRVCMDQIIVGVSHIPEARVGDEVVLVGPGLSADEVARQWGTINYDVTSGIMARVARVYPTVRAS